MEGLRTVPPAPPRRALLSGKQGAGPGAVHRLPGRTTGAAHAAAFRIPARPSRAALLASGPTPRTRIAARGGETEARRR